MRDAHLHSNNSLSLLISETLAGHDVRSDPSVLAGDNGVILLIWHLHNVFWPRRQVVYVVEYTRKSPRFVPIREHGSVPLLDALIRFSYKAS